ncbi:MAG TPA: HD-GYP domain-containing protein [Gaiellaceae bacterium]|nr:HD-GYP domain-containing protein [Gaiellaceae bacterium]
MLRRFADEGNPYLLLGGAAAAALPAILHVAVGGVEVGFNSHLHFYAVSFSALTAAVAAGALTWFGATRRDTRTMLVGTAFAAMASLLALHGLASPGVLVGRNGVVAVTGGTTLPVGGIILAASVLPLPRVLRNLVPFLALEAALLLCFLGLGLSALFFPGIVPDVPGTGSPEAYALLAVGLAAYAVVGWRAFRTFLLTQRFLDLLVVVGVAWLATALVPALTMAWDYLGWWIGHEVELDGILLVGIAVAVDLARAAQARPLAGDLSGAELVQAEDVFLGSHVRALTVTLAEKDAYTERHTRRVALLAVQVGEELGLSKSRLRTLAIGGLVHDIGKLSVPDAILRKPGPLDDDEYAVIKQHPESGHKLLGELGSFSEGVRRLVLDHHERLDGTGYPRGLSGEQIDLDTRILTACDVYDALITKRVYRPAWTHAEAVAFLRSELGSAFDERVVEALERVTGGEPVETGRPAPRFVPAAAAR